MRPELREVRSTIEAKPRLTVISSPEKTNHESATE
jgi:hypothetical protein